MSDILGRRLPSLSRTIGEPPGVVAGDSCGVARGVSQGEAVPELLPRPDMEWTAERTRSLAILCGVNRRENRYGGVQEEGRLFLRLKTREGECVARVPSTDAKR